MVPLSYWFKRIENSSPFLRHMIVHLNMTRSRFVVTSLFITHYTRSPCSNRPLCPRTTKCIEMSSHRPRLLPRPSYSRRVEPLRSLLAAGFMVQRAGGRGLVIATNNPTRLDAPLGHCGERRGLKGLQGVCFAVVLCHANGP